MLKRILLAALCLPLTALAQSYPSPTYQNVTVLGTLTASGGNSIGLGALAQQAANTVLANATGSTANVTAFAMPSCSTSSSALNWTSGSGFTCGTVATPGANSNITSLSGLSTPLSIAQGGTGSGTQAGALSNILGSSSVPVANGGTARATLTAHSVLLGNGTSGVNSVGPNATSGLALISQGSSADPIFGLPTGTLVNVQRFTSSGTYTPTAGATSAIVMAVGGGGGGGGSAATTSSQVALGGAGSAGAWGVARITSLSSQTVTIGSAGSGGAAGANAGTNGGQTSIGTWLVCPGGVGGPAGAATAITSTNVNGVPAGFSGSPSSSGSLLEGSAGNVGTYALWGFNGAGSVNLGQGGNSRFGAGGFVANLGAGSSGNGFGAGGSGASGGASASAAAGGNGTAGYVIVYEYN